MKILILGGDGMLGHQLLRQLVAAHEVYVTLRRDPEAYRSRIPAIVRAEDQEQLLGGYRSR